MLLETFFTYAAAVSAAKKCAESGRRHPGLWRKIYRVYRYYGEYDEWALLSGECPLDFPDKHGAALFEARVREDK